MKSKHIMALAALLTLGATTTEGARAQAPLARVDMTVTPEGSLTEVVSGTTLALEGVHDPENIPGAAGQALRLDGYSSWAHGVLSPAPGRADAPALTVSLWVAPETYPVVKIDTPTDERAALATTLDAEGRSGWAMTLGYTGHYGFRCFSGGWEVALEASDLLPCYEWSHLVAVVDGASSTATLYRNGQVVATARCMATVDSRMPFLALGKDMTDVKQGPFLLNTFNGLLDDLEVYESALTPEQAAATAPEHEADLAIPASRFASDRLRPRFHGMPAAAWTNECHGMTFSDGRFHLFFQKNANGPYMTRLHWGHISSENLYNWREEPIALAPGEPYDVKGCWSGCVFTDPQITGSLPAAIYTGVDYSKASMNMARPADASLLHWTKTASNPVVAGRPAGLSDDFRDPYFFRSGDQAYLIAGSSKGGVGTTTLHRYNAASGLWSNDGDTFFSGSSAAAEGTFWEMPNVTPLGADGTWLFTATPLNTAQGVRTLYWTGAIDAQGHFQPRQAAPSGVELISKDGYGMLSPTVYTHQGSTIALGIVPDKLSWAENHRLGWAHCYSLPRLWSLDEASGSLVQKPYPGLEGMRTDCAFGRGDFALEGSLPLDPVRGRQAEVRATFAAGTAPFGFSFFKSGSSEATLTYYPASGELRVDLTGLHRLVNDASSYAGVYSCTLPATDRPAPGSDMTLTLYIDHSIIDVFVADRWATSIRVFPTDDDADGLEAFSQGAPTNVRSLRAWTLDPLAQGGSGSLAVPFADGGSAASSPCDVVDLGGRLVRRAPSRAEALSGLPSGIYIVAGQKSRVH